MKLTPIFFILMLCLWGCKDKELPAKHLSTISVIRETESNRTLTQNKQNTTTQLQQPTGQAPRQYKAPSRARYHVIVASFSYSEKARAERLVAQLKAKNYPATLINSAQRFRVSIENFATETEANSARDEYRAVTDRQDIWVHKVE